MAKLLIIGRMPPPIGGVTVHVRRLTQGLQRAGFDFDFCDPGKSSVFKIHLEIVKHPVIHIHFSNPVAQLAFAIFCRITRKKLIISYHGCWGRFRAVGNQLVKLSARIAHVPVVQERAGLRQALRCNARSQQISPYIPDSGILPLPACLQSEIATRRTHYEATFCTNAWNLTFDKYGREIYRISEIVDRFVDYPEYRLLISDPSGNYRSHIQKHTPKIPSNVFFISHLHDFKSILLLSDAFIRNTSTDGVSLSIHEARAFGIPILASAAAERPPFCSIFQDFSKTDLKEKLEEAKRLIAVPHSPADTVAELIKLYQDIGGKSS